MAADPDAARFDLVKPLAKGLWTRTRRGNWARPATCASSFEGRMSNGNDGDGRQPPSDDRTLLDPLSPEELKALREARQRMQAKRKDAGGVIKHQVVIGPGEQEGDAPTRAMPSLPSFDGQISLEKLQVSSPPQAAEREEALGAGLEDTLTSPEPSSDPDTIPGGEVHGSPPRDRAPSPSTDLPRPGGSSDVPRLRRNPVREVDRSADLPLGGRAGTGDVPSDANPPGQQPPGFGENTMMWMRRPQAPTTAPTSTTLPTPSSAEKASNLARNMGILAVVAAIAVAGVYAFGDRPRGTVELHTNPPNARLYIDGRLSEEPTPVRLNLSVGDHVLRVEKEGYQPSELPISVAEGDGGRTDIDLVPVSDPGLITVGVRVEPVAGDLTLDDRPFPKVRAVQIPNVDPSKPHTFRVQAPGYLKTERVVPAGELKATYSFTLEPDIE